MTIHITGPVERLARMKESWPKGPIRAAYRDRLLTGKRRLKRIIDAATMITINQAARIDDAEKRRIDIDSSDLVLDPVRIEDK